MAEVGQGLAAEDGDIILIGGAPHRVTIQLRRVPDEVDPAVAHLRTDKDGLGRIRMEVCEASSSLNPVGKGVEAAAVAWEPLGIIHQEHAAQLSCGGKDGWYATTGLVSSDCAIDAALHA